MLVLESWASLGEQDALHAGVGAQMLDLRAIDECDVAVETGGEPIRKLPEPGAAPNQQRSHIDHQARAEVHQVGAVLDPGIAVDDQSLGESLEVQLVMDMQTPGGNPPGIGLGQSQSPQNPKGSAMVIQVQDQRERMNAIPVEDGPKPIRVEIPRKIHGQDESFGWKIVHGRLEQGFESFLGAGSQAPENAVFHPAPIHGELVYAPFAGEKLTPKFLGPGGCMRSTPPQNGQGPLIGASCG